MSRGALYGDVRKINGRRPNNFRFAGGAFPPERLPKEYRETGLYFSKQGFPDFKPYAVKEVVLEDMSFTTDIDTAKANAAAGIPKEVWKKNLEDQFVWHHCPGTKIAMLIPKALHKAVYHTGGVAVSKHLARNPKAIAPLPPDVSLMLAAAARLQEALIPAPLVQFTAGNKRTARPVQPRTLALS